MISAAHPGELPAAVQWPGVLPVGIPVAVQVNTIGIGTAIFIFSIGQTIRIQYRQDVERYTHRAPDLGVR